MEKRVQELLRRKPGKWGNLTVKAFEQDMKLLQDTLREEMKKTESYEQIMEFYADSDSYIRHFENHPSNIEVDKGRMAREVMAENGSVLVERMTGEKKNDRRQDK